MRRWAARMIPQKSSCTQSGPPLHRISSLAAIALPLQSAIDELQPACPHPAEERRTFAGKQIHPVE